MRFRPLQEMYYRVALSCCRKRGMARHLHLEPHLSADDLAGRYRATKDPVERSRWHFLWLLARGLTAKLVASITGYSAYWIGRIARRYNQQGPKGVKDLRHQSRPSTLLLPAPQQDELAAALAAGSAPEGDRWSGRSVAGAGGRSLPGSVSVWADMSVASSAGVLAAAGRTAAGAPPPPCARRRAGLSRLQATAAPAAARGCDRFPPGDR
jgi:Winged helix-turn helix